MTWQPIRTAPERVVVWTKLHDEKGYRNEAKLVKEGNLWWLPDMSMYVYWTPTHWMEV